MLGQCILCVTFQVLASRMLQNSPSFTCRAGCESTTLEVSEVSSCYELGAACCLLQPLGCPDRPISSDTKENILSAETSIAFLLSLFQYLAASLVFNLSSSLRMPFYTNAALMLNFLVALISSLLILFALDPSSSSLSWIGRTLDTLPLPGSSLVAQILFLALLYIASVVSHELFLERTYGKARGGLLAQCSQCFSVLSFLSLILAADLLLYVITIGDI